MENTENPNGVSEAEKSMPQLLAQVLVHIVFATKPRWGTRAR